MLDKIDEFTEVWRDFLELDADLKMNLKVKREEEPKEHIQLKERTKNMALQMRNVLYRVLSLIPDIPNTAHRRYLNFAEKRYNELIDGLNRIIWQPHPTFISLHNAVLHAESLCVRDPEIPLEGRPIWGNIGVEYAGRNPETYLEIQALERRLQRK